ncbi:MAG: VOC family protein [Pirellulales bacterium]
MGQSVIPTLVYADIAAAHDFLARAFGFEPGGVQRDGEGRVVHGEVRTGESVIWLHRVIAEHKLASPASLGSASSGLVVYVDDLDAHCDQARRAGAVIEREPEDMPYGQREYGARDPEGHRWWFAAPLQPTNEPIADG